MKTRDVLKVVSVALGTATLTVLSGWPGSLEATHEGEANVPKVANPKLVSHGIEMSVTAGAGQKLRAGEAPTFELQAYNPTAAPAKAAVRVAMSTTSLASAMSRVPARAGTVWQQEQTVVLAPKETKTFTLPAAKQLPANALVSVALQESDASANADGVRPASTALFPYP